MVKPPRARHWFAGLLASAMLVSGLALPAHANGDDPEWLYRVDTREPEQIFETGFAPRGDSTNLLDHVTAAGGSPAAARSGFVAMTSDQTVAQRLAGLYLDEAESNGDEEPTVYIYSIAPNGHMYDVHRSLVAHADDARQQGASPEYVLGVRSAVQTIAAHEHEWASDVAIAPRSIIEAEVWTRTDGEDSQTDDEVNDRFDPSSRGEVSGHPYRWPLPLDAVMPEELAALRLPMGFGTHQWIAPSLYAFFAECDMMRSDMCDTEHLTHQETLVRTASGAYITTAERDNIPADSLLCRLSAHDTGQFCDTRWNQATSPDGWQRLRSKYDIRRPANSDQLTVGYIASDLEYYWGVRWHHNTYDVWTTVSAQVEALDGTVLDTWFGHVHHDKGRYAGGTVIRTVPRDTPHIVRVTTAVAGMYWSTSPESSVRTEQVFYFG